MDPEVLGRARIDGGEVGASSWRLILDAYLGQAQGRSKRVGAITPKGLVHRAGFEPAFSALRGRRVDRLPPTVQVLQDRARPTDPGFATPNLGPRLRHPGACANVS